MKKQGKCVTRGSPKYKQTNSLRMLDNKNGVKGSDFVHKVVTPFFQIRGLFLLLFDNNKGSLFEPQTQFYEKAVSIELLIISIIFKILLTHRKCSSEHD